MVIEAIILDAVALLLYWQTSSILDIIPCSHPSVWLCIMQEIRFIA